MIHYIIHVGAGAGGAGKKVFQTERAGAVYTYLSLTWKGSVGCTEMGRAFRVHM